MKGNWGSGGIAPQILDFGTRWRFNAKLKLNFIDFLKSSWSFKKGTTSKIDITFRLTTFIWTSVQSDICNTISFQTIAQVI
jgi:hypothetical protein